MIEDTTMNNVLEPTLERFDQATKTHNGFTAVLVDLEALSATDPIMGLTDVWQLWHQET